MKRIPIFVLALFLATSAVWAQNKNAKPAKAKPAAVDCSATTDAQITENVKAKLAGTASLKDQTINAATSGGEVTLTGSVKKGNQKGLATMQAKRVPCVKKVDNQITVEGAAPKKPAKPKNSNKSM
ncbi:MAG: BON domain-containing protein [Acidobacteriota bacterium]